MTEHMHYRAAYEGAVWNDMAACGRLFTRDRDRAALLHRLSTNEIEALQPGQGTRTVLTTPIGRIIDLVTVYHLPDADDPRLLLVSSPGQGGALFKHLKKNIFFNDKLRLENASQALGQIGVYGPQATTLLAGLADTALADVPRHGVRAVALAGVASYVARDLPLGGEGWQLFAPSEAMPGLAAALAAAGALPLDAATYEVLRVEHGHPAFGHELSLDYIPLETDLWDAISFKKGCYVGQEIIARMESRGRLAKMLRGLVFPQGTALPSTLPAQCIANGKDAGALTSLVASPTHGTIGLGYIRTAHAEPGTTIGIAGSDAVATVVALPFA